MHNSILKKIVHSISDSARTYDATGIYILASLESDDVGVSLPTN
jgi:hypothetical protein